jgi:hypothetical protein
MAVQAKPFPVYPALHEQEKPPEVLEQLALELHGLELHSLLSAHVNPFPVNPPLQAQTKLPTVLVQKAFDEHGLPSHSLMSAHVMPALGFPA